MSQNSLFQIKRLDFQLYRLDGIQSETNILRFCMTTQSLSYNQLLIYGHLVSLSFNKTVFNTLRLFHLFIFTAFDGKHFQLLNKFLVVDQTHAICYQ